MVMRLAPSRGGFLRPFGCGWFIREFLLGNGPEGSRKIDPAFGAAQSDINYEYKEALARATAQGQGRKDYQLIWCVRRRRRYRRRSRQQYMNGN